MDFRTQVRSVTLSLLGDEHPFRAEIEGRNAGRLCHFQPNITVKSSIDIEISSEGSDIKSRSIVTDHGKSVLSRIYIVGYLKGKSIVCPLVFSDEHGIDQDIGYAACAFESQEDPFTGIVFRYFEKTGIGPVPPIISVFRLEILSIVAMRECHRLAGCLPAEGRARDRAGLDKAFDKCPTLIQRLDFACKKNEWRYPKEQ
jgi:hypothetical protein